MPTIATPVYAGTTTVSGKAAAAGGSRGAQCQRHGTAQTAMTADAA
ncbi:hypothetical protein REC12_24280 [Desulfosporosinus sp. PR]|nr:hypothetical protein [Desulfosporosinus sp. PR]